MIGTNIERQLSVVLCLLALSIFTNNIFAQVTIGSGKRPIDGALLQLKEEEGTGANAKKGLLLPRVELTDKDNLYPMLEESPGSGTPGDMYTPGLKDTEDTNHIGLLVFNTNKCKGFARGVYTWTGKEWTQVTNNPVLDLPSISINGQSDKEATTTIHIPSGTDLRTFNPAQNMSVAWTSAGLNTSITSRTNSVGGGISFTNNPPSGWASPLPTNPTSYSFNVDDMSGATGIWYENPWQTRETIIEFATSTDECGASATKRVILNQTNFALQVNGLTSDFNFLIKEPFNYNSFGFNPVSNAKWLTSYSEETSGIVSNITVPSQGGAENIAGGKTAPWYFPVKHSNSNQPNKKYKIAGRLTFQDSTPAPDNRFAPITVTIIRCQNNADMTTVTIDGDVTSESLWGDNVVKHTDQEGNIFYSAKFGNARWMITNLAATSYDDGETLNMINVHDSDSTTIKRSYAYPRYVEGLPGQDKLIGPEGWGVPPERVAGKGTPWYREQGLLYNWYAATNMLDPTPYNIDQGQASVGVDGTPGGNEVEQLGDKGIAPNAYIQGICPKGWHLPSDREWNRLEKELYNNAKNYSVYTTAQLAKFVPLTWNENYEITNGKRGSIAGNGEYGHGGVMKEMCSVDDIEWNWMTTSKGYSKEPSEGGFNIISVGGVRGPIMDNYGYSGAFWTSSRWGFDGAWGRYTDYESSYVNRHLQKRHALYSVRCVKN